MQERGSQPSGQEVTRASSGDVSEGEKEGMVWGPKLVEAAAGLEEDCLRSERLRGLRTSGLQRGWGAGEGLAAIATCHKLAGCEPQKFILSQHWRPGVETQVRVGPRCL